MTLQAAEKTTFSLLKSGACALSIALAAVLATGCGNGSSGGGSSSSAPASEAAQISGNVQDQHGPIMEGTVEVRDKNGQVVTSTQLSGTSNHYSLNVPAGAVYPIVLSATPPEGSSSVPVKAVVTSPLADRMDITDVTTIVVDSAISLGGLTAENIAKASGAAIGLRQREGVSAGAGGGGGGAGQSGGGVSRGGHGGHDMSNMGGGAGGTDPNQSNQPNAMPGMNH